MSYARFGEADVYVYVDLKGLACCACRLSPQSLYLASTAEMLAHLDTHRAAGHDVPDYTYDDLRCDAAENDQWIASGGVL